MSSEPPRPPSPPWAAERVVGPEDAARLIAAQFPALAPVTVEPAGVSWDNTVFRVNGAWAGGARAPS